MAQLLDPKTGKPAKFAVNDQAGNAAIGHFEFTSVPSFEPGTRLGDLSFVIDEQTESAGPVQVDLRLMGGGISS